MAKYTENEEKVLQQFGCMVRILRKEHGLSQEGLANLVGLHRTYIGDIERGRRNVSLLNICKIAEALEIPVATLFDAFIVE